MKSLSLLAVVVSVAVAAAATAKAPSSADERKRLTGTWRGKMAHESEPSMELVITPTTISGRSLHNGESLGVGTYDVDPVKKTLDAHGIKDPVSGKTYLGIYSLEGDTLKWCSNSGSNKRPKDLSVSPTGSHFLMILQRQK